MKATVEALAFSDDGEIKLIFRDRETDQLFDVDIDHEGVHDLGALLLQYLKYENGEDVEEAHILQ